MNVAELIKILESMPPDAEVVTEGYETGYEPIKKVTTLYVEPNEGKNWWDGKYDKATNTQNHLVVFLDAETKKDS